MPKICYNGQFIDKTKFFLSVSNRAFKYGDSFFETIKCVDAYPLFWEEHYFRIAGSFVILKFSTPDFFNIEYFKDLIHELLILNKLSKSSSRVRISFFRNDGGYYLPNDNSISFVIETDVLKSKKYILNHEGLVFGIYKENLLYNNYISRLKSNNKILNIIASIYAKEHHFDDVLLLNNKHNVVESTFGNLFIISNGDIITPPVEEGCVDGVMRKVLIDRLELKINLKPISISDLLNAEEVFISNVIRGIQWCSLINNKKLSNKFTISLNQKLNKLI